MRYAQEWRMRHGGRRTGYHRQATVMKMNARKVRRIYHDEVVVGFAGP